jgi:hypothetical protein
VGWAHPGLCGSEGSDLRGSGSARVSGFPEQTKAGDQSSPGILAATRTETHKLPL